MIGTCTITKNDAQDTTFQLTNVPFLSPISGHVHVYFDIQYHSIVEHKGFLGIFEDVGHIKSPFRRWCVLYNGVISMWDYPDDENIKPPRKQIHLYQCNNEKITYNSRKIYQDTFEFTTVRLRKKSDKENLMAKFVDNTIVFDHCMAADSKEERAEWLKMLNKSLKDVREWDNRAERINL